MGEAGGGFLINKINWECLGEMQGNSGVTRVVWCWKYKIYIIKIASEGTVSILMFICKAVNEWDYNIIIYKYHYYWNQTTNK